MRFLLVNPVFPLSLWDFSLNRDIDGYAYPHPPLALPTLAALTPPGHDVRLLDENVTPLDVDAAAAGADVIGLTGYWIQRQRLFELADAFRARGKTVVIGGPIVDGATVDRVAQHADHVFQGEAEYTWPAFVRDLESGAAKPRYVQATLVDMQDSPTPRFDLLDHGAYSSATVETSRGCPYACEFCEIPARLGQKSRTKSVDQVLAEVRAHYALGAKTVFFIDDHMLGNRKRARKLLGALATFVRSIDYRMFFSCQFTINLAKDDELLELLYQANFRRVFVGIESPRKDALVSANKKQNLVVDLVQAVRRLHAHNIIVWAGIIVGFDSDDADVFDDQLRFLQEAGIPVAMMGLLQAIPGTPLHRRMVAEGRLRDDGDSTQMGGVRGTYQALIQSNIVPTAMDEATLVRGYQRLVAAVYDPERYADRVLDALLAGERPLHGPQERWRPARRDLRNVGILGRLLRYYLVTRDSDRRRMFTRVVGRILRERPAALEQALMHLVVHKHLKTFYDRVAALPAPAPASHTPRANPRKSA